MINVSTAFKNAMKAPVKTVSATVAFVGGDTYTSGDDLVKCELQASGYYFGVATKAVTVVLLGTNYNLVDKKFDLTLKVLTDSANDTWEDCILGRFKVVEQTIDLEKEMTTLKAYDAIGIIGSKLYEAGDFTFPITVNDLAERLAADSGMSVDELELVNGTYQIPEDLYANINNITHRDILAEISGATASLAAVHGVDSNLTFTTPMMEPVDALGYENLKKIKLEPEYGKVSSVVIARTPQEDNTAVVDEETAKEPSGKNLINGEMLPAAAYEYNGTSSQYYRDINTGVEIEAGKTYTLSMQVDEASNLPYMLSVGVGANSYARDVATKSNLTTVGDRVFITFTPTAEQISIAGGRKLFYRCPRYGQATVFSYKISNHQLEENSQMTDYESFKPNGIVEVKLANNEILDDNREAMATPILDAVKGFEFYPFEATTEGHGWHEVGDRINVFAEPYLPEAYQQVEYIENQGGQYIDTGIKACMNNIRCVCDMAAMSDADSAFFGSRGSYYLFYNFANNYFWPISRANTIEGTLVVGNKYHVDWDKGAFTVTGEDGVYQNATRSNATQDTQNMYIFNFNPRDGRQSLARVYYFKIYDNNALVRDFVPCYRKADGVAGLYDKKNGVFYPSAGGGNFAVGADASNGESVAEVIVTGVKLTIDGGFREELKGVAPDETRTNYALAGGIKKTIYNTEIKVDKQGQEITSIVSRQDQFEDQTLDNFSQVVQNINSVVTTIQTTGGGNLIHNSVGYNKDTDGSLVAWTASGTVSSETSPESVSYGAISGNQINLGASSSISQRVTVDTTGSVYTLGFKAKKGAVGTVTVHMRNSIDDYFITIPNGEAVLWSDFSIEGMVPHDNYFDVVITADSNVTEFAITDLMLTTGDSKTPWVSASDEILSRNVAVDSDGVKVTSNTSNDYVKLDELGLNGYSDATGTLENVFTINRDLTEVSKLKARNQIEMPPLKIVPITSGSRAGWSWVKNS